MGAGAVAHGISIRYRCYQVKEGDSLRLAGCLLLLSGFFIVLAALVLLTAFPPRLAFTVAGLAVEALGLALLTQGHKPVEKEQR
jgi:hypothetical protein